MIVESYYNVFIMIASISMMIPLVLISIMELYSH